MKKPKVKPYLDWIELEEWFEKKHPKQFDRQKIVDWLVGDDGCANGQLLHVDDECLSKDFKPSDYIEGIDWDAVKFFMQTIVDTFPDAVEQYGGVRILYWW